MQSIIAMFVIVVGATTTTMLYLERKFSEHRKLVYQLERNFYRIISQHNREDDDRFLAIQEIQWELREYVARRDGTKLPHRKPFPRRRYVQDDESEQPA